MQWVTHIPAQCMCCVTLIEHNTQDSKAPFYSAHTLWTFKNLNKCIESLTFLLSACVTLIDSKAPIYCAMIDRMFRCQTKGFYYVFIFTTSNKRPQALSLIIRTCVYFDILFDIYYIVVYTYDTLWLKLRLRRIYSRNTSIYM